MNSYKLVPYVWRRRLMDVLTWSVLVLSVASYLTACYRLSAQTTDDAYISFRFARNLAEGHGLVWNIGGERVEGYTNALWVFLAALLHVAGLEIEKCYPWLFKEEIVRREYSYLQNGSKLLFPMPFCCVVTKEGETRQ